MSVKIMKKILTTGRLIFGIAASLVLATGAFGQPPAKQAVRQLYTSNKPLTGDFDQMVARRMIWVLVPYSRTLYFNDKGHERGIAADNVRDFEHWINEEFPKAKVQRCQIHVARNVLAKVPRKLKEAVGR